MLDLAFFGDVLALAGQLAGIICLVLIYIQKELPFFLYKYVFNFSVAQKLKNLQYKQKKCPIFGKKNLTSNACSFLNFKFKDIKLKRKESSL